MDKIKIDNELPKLAIQTTGELPLISVDEESCQAYRTLHMIEEADKKSIRRNQFKHDFFIAIISATASAIFTNIDRIIRFVTELISLLADFLPHQQ